MADDRSKPNRDQDKNATKDLPPKPVDKQADDKVKGGFGKPQVDATKKIM